MTAAEIRQSFLDFFRERQHTIVPSSSLLPSSPNLLFTNAGMNQFVPYFLAEAEPPFRPPRAADTQKCIRAGGKHNDLDDVGFDTYHQTFFEMLGNWSFGDYFKREAIQWAWELLVGRWGFPPERLYATVYRPGPGDPAEFDQEASDAWSERFRRAKLDPAVHVLAGNRKDNFWMMGDTGPCGPCSEIHIDLTAAGDTKGSLVNQGSPWCIEIWNLVFIQFNANPDGTFSALPARHVDTGMGFERVAGIVAGTKRFTQFQRLVSNYDSDVFQPIFSEIGALSGKSYGGTLPDARADLSAQQRADVAFRVVADHIRTLACAIADGILPGNNDRNYVVRRILRRAVMFGRDLGFGEHGFLATLAPVVVRELGSFFPELKREETRIVRVLADEEELFNRTLDRGLKLFSEQANKVKDQIFPAEAAFRLYD
ncbi:MAG: alanine--tRNA ligase, partial [Verrucomicrobia bacterium]|nr:alanine--tRNA ligase [Verrucomicrobiota bacterium]